MSLLADAVLEALLISVQLLDGQRSDDAAQVTGERLLDRRLDLRDRHPEKTLGSRTDVFDVSADLDLCHRLDVDRNAANGVDVRQVDLESHHLQRKKLVAFPAGPDEGTAASNDAERLDRPRLVPDLPAQKLPPTEDDQSLVRTGLLVAHLDDEIDDEERKENSGKDDQHFDRS